MPHSKLIETFPMFFSTTYQQSLAEPHRTSCPYKSVKNPLIKVECKTILHLKSKHFCNMVAKWYFRHLQAHSYRWMPHKTQNEKIESEPFFFTFKVFKHSFIGWGFRKEGTRWSQKPNRASGFGFNQDYGQSEKFTARKISLRSVLVMSNNFVCFKLVWTTTKH